MKVAEKKWCGWNAQRKKTDSMDDLDGKCPKCKAELVEKEIEEAIGEM